MPALNGLKVLVDFDARTVSVDNDLRNRWEDSALLILQDRRVLLRIHL